MVHLKLGRSECGAGSKRENPLVQVQVCPSGHSASCSQSCFGSLQRARSAIDPQPLSSPGARLVLPPRARPPSGHRLRALHVPLPQGPRLPLPGTHRARSTERGQSGDTTGHGGTAARACLSPRPPPVPIGHRHPRSRLSPAFSPSVANHRGVPLMIDSAATAQRGATWRTPALRPAGRCCLPPP